MNAPSFPRLAEEAVELVSADNVHFFSADAQILAFPAQLQRPLGALVFGRSAPLELTALLIVRHDDGAGVASELLKLAKAASLAGSRGRIARRGPCWALSPPTILLLGRRGLGIGLHEEFASRSAARS